MAGASCRIGFIDNISALVPRTLVQIYYHIMGNVEGESSVVASCSLVMSEFSS